MLPSAILDYYPALGEPKSLELVVGEGFSGAQVWRVQTAQGAYALKRTSEIKEAESRFPWIHGVLEHAWREGFHRLPLPQKNRQGRTVTIAAAPITPSSSLHHDPSAWVVSPWMPGTPLPEGQATEASIASAAKTLAAWHHCVSSHPDCVNDSPLPCMQRRRDHVSGWMDGNLERLQTVLCKTPASDKVLLAQEITVLAKSRLPALAHRLSSACGQRGRLLPAIRDIWRPHVLFRGAQVVGMIDFDAMRLDSPVVDIARLLGSFCGVSPALWNHGTEAYGRELFLSQQDLQNIELLDAANRVLSPLNWLRWIYLEERTFANDSHAWRRIKTLAERIDPTPRRQWDFL